MDCKIGDIKEFVIDSKIVKVTILDNMKTVYPNPTDEMIVEYVKGKDEINHIKTVDEYIEYLQNKFKKDWYDKAFTNNLNEVIDYVIIKSDWKFDEDEVNELYTTLLNETKSSLEEENLKLEELSEYQLNLRYGVNSLDEFHKYLRNMAEYYIAYAYFQITLENKDPKTISYMEGMQMGWDQLHDYVEKQMKM